MKNLILPSLIFLFSNLLAQWNDFEWETIEFETPYQYIEISSSSENIWEIGEPNKSFFDSAFSAPNAMITNATSFYPINNYSYFDLFIGNYNIDWFPDDIFIDIKHKFDTDTLKDGGYITVSYDMGQTWRNIINDTPTWTSETPDSDMNLFIENLYTSENTLFNGEKGFSGNSGDWITTRFSWYTWPSRNPSFMGDTMILRFNFISDDLETNREGWIIDNIKLYSKDLGGNIIEYKKNIFNLFPNPTSSFFVIKSEKLKVEDCRIFNAQGQLIEQFQIQTTDTRISISNWTKGLYFVKIGTETQKLVVE